MPSAPPHPPHVCPRSAGGSAEAMSTRRRDLVSNGPLAEAAARLGLQRHLRAGSGALVAAVARFVDIYLVGGGGGGLVGGVGGGRVWAGGRDGRGWEGR